MPRALVGQGLYPSIDDDWWIRIRGGVVRCVCKAPNAGKHLLFSSLTTAPNGVVEPLHDKAMTV
jgi:putative SOS response-associated peptidase YedK